MRIRAAVWPGDGPRTVLIFPGRTEYIEKYGPVAARLVRRGFSVVAIDWRGQGLSDRQPGVGRLGHIDDFAEYQSDLQAVLQLAPVGNLPSERILFCHSMGGCIGLRSLVSGLDITRAVFSAPMWGLRISATKRVIAASLARIAGFTGLSGKLAPTQSAEPYVLRQQAEGNDLTTDTQTYRWFQDHLRQRPELLVGGLTIGWVGAALREVRALDGAAPPSVPALVLLGSEERVVPTDAIRRQVGRMPSAKLVEVAGSRHEVWMESEARQALVWKAIDAFIGIATP